MTKLIRKFIWKTIGPDGLMSGRGAIFDVLRQEKKGRIRRQIDSSFQKESYKRGTFAGA